MPFNNWSNCKDLFLCQFRIMFITEKVLLLDRTHSTMRMVCLHVGVQYPIKVFLAFLWASRAALDSPEQTWTPFYSFVRPYRGCLSLAIFNFRLLLCRKVVIFRIQGFYSFMPEFLRLAFRLLLKRASYGWCVFRIRRVEKQFPLTCLWWR